MRAWVWAGANFISRERQVLIQRQNLNFHLAQYLGTGAISAKRFGIGSASFQVHDLTFSIPASPRKNGIGNGKLESKFEN